MILTEKSVQYSVSELIDIEMLEFVGKFLTVFIRRGRVIFRREMSGDFGFMMFGFLVTGF